MIDLSTPGCWVTFTVATNEHRLKAQKSQCKLLADALLVHEEKRGACPCSAAYCCPFRKQIEQESGRKHG